MMDDYIIALRSTQHSFLARTLECEAYKIMNTAAQYTQEGYNFHKGAYYCITGGFVDGL